MGMEDRDGKIWMDGQLVDWRDAKIHVLTHTLHYGCGAFEGVRAYKTAQGTAIFRLREHTERLFNSAKILRMKIPFTQEQVSEAQRARLIEAAGALVADGQRGRVTQTLNETLLALYRTALSGRGEATYLPPRPPSPARQLLTWLGF